MIRRALACVVSFGFAGGAAAEPCPMFGLESQEGGIVVGEVPAAIGDKKPSPDSTQGGCVSLFADGTVISQPGDRLVAFWVDAYGRRSRVSPMAVVEKAR